MGQPEQAHILDFFNFLSLVVFSMYHEPVVFFLYQRARIIWRGFSLLHSSSFSFVLLHSHLDTPHSTSYSRLLQRDFLSNHRSFTRYGVSCRTVSPECMYVLLSLTYLCNPFHETGKHVHMHAKPGCWTPRLLIPMQVIR